MFIKGELWKMEEIRIIYFVFFKFKLMWTIQKFGI